LAPGVTVEPLAFPAGAEEPAVYRLSLAPGATYDFLANPGTALEFVLVEAGELRLTVDTEVSIARLEAMAGGSIAAGTEISLAAGDYLVLPAMTSGNVSNDGSQPGSLVVTSITAMAAQPISSQEPVPTGSPAATS
jgi:hypothetical protein